MWPGLFTKSVIVSRILLCPMIRVWQKSSSLHRVESCSLPEMPTTSVLRIDLNIEAMMCVIMIMVVIMMVVMRVTISIVIVILLIIWMLIVFGADCGCDIGGWSSWSR